jgi:hypothetical protein
MPLNAEQEALMNPDKKPWLFLKRLETWSPLAAVRPMLIPAVNETIAEESGPREGM